jgi:glycosyltransferase involved in cell wall biosynthesis
MINDNESTTKICVIIPCYNHSNFLKESVASIQNQTYDNLDIVIVNDGSSDNTDDIIKELISDSNDKRLRHITFKTNFGKWHALNEGINSTSAILVTSHDADDVCHKNRIERQLTCMTETNSVHNLCGFHHCWDEKDVIGAMNNVVDGNMKVMMPQLVTRLVEKGYNNPSINHYFTGEFETAGTTALFYKQIWDIGLRFNPPDKGLRVLNSEDSDFNFRVTAALAKTSVLAEKLYCYRRDTSTNNEMR